MRKHMTHEQVEYCYDIFKQVSEALENLDEYVARQPEFCLNQRTASLGMCYINPYQARIEISEYNLDAQGLPHLATLVHECIHGVLQCGVQHGEPFKRASRICSEIFGVPLSRLATEEEAKVFISKLPKPKYVIVWEDGDKQEYRRKAWIVKDLLANNCENTYVLTDGTEQRARLVVR